MYSIKQKIKSLFKEVKRTIQLNLKYNEYMANTSSNENDDTNV